jgi:hypothetical protein
MVKKVSSEFINKAKEDFGEGDVKCFNLLDTDKQQFLGCALFHTPEEYTLKTFYRLFKEEPIKARRALITGTLCDCEMKEEISKAPGKSILFSAAFDAASEMLPGGKAEVVEI